MPNYNRFHVHFYLKATCNILLYAFKLVEAPFHKTYKKKLNKHLITEKHEKKIFLRDIFRVPEGEKYEKILS